MQTKPVLRSALALSLIISITAAHAGCFVKTAAYAGGAFGAESEALPGGCFRAVDGGVGSTSSAQSSATMSASADLQSGIIASYSSGNISSSALWDTITFHNIAAGGEWVTEDLSLTGSITGGSGAYVNISSGTGVAGDASSLAQSDVYLDSTTGVPASVQASFIAYNNESVLVYAQLQTYGYNGISDLSDPPRFSLGVPDGVTYTSASGVFGLASTVPEPSSLALIAGGLALLGSTGRRRRS